jgi:protein SCO1
MLRNISRKLSKLGANVQPVRLQRPRLIPRIGSSARFATSEKPGRNNAQALRGPVTFASLAVTGVIGIGVLIYYQLEKEKKMEKVASEVVTTGKPALGGPFVLVDQDGIPKTDASFRGNFLMLYFGFTYCPDICPSELVKVGKILDELKRKNIGTGDIKVKPVFISVDPARDTVGQMKFYSKDFHPDFTFLTGTREQVAAITKAYRVYFSKANENIADDEDYLVDHSIVVYLINPEGEFLHFFTQKSQVGDVADKIAEYYKDYEKSHKGK